MNAILSSIRSNHVRKLLRSVAMVALLGLLPQAASAIEFDAAIAVDKPGGVSVQVNNEQMQQLDIAPAKARSLTAVKTAIGQIAFNEDASTVVLTPFSGRVTRLIASGSARTSTAAIRCSRSTARKWCRRRPI